MPRSTSKMSAAQDRETRATTGADRDRLGEAHHDLEHIGLMVEEGRETPPRDVLEYSDRLFTDLPHEEPLQEHWRDGSCLF